MLCWCASAHELRRRIAPYFLRREKKDVLPSSGQEGSASSGGSGGGIAGEHSSAGGLGWPSEVELMGSECGGVAADNDDQCRWGGVAF